MLNTLYLNKITCTFFTLKHTFTEIPVEKQSATNKRDQQQADDTGDSYQCDSIVRGSWWSWREKDLRDPYNIQQIRLNDQNLKN